MTYRAVKIRDDEGPIGEQMREKGFDFSSVVYARAVEVAREAKWNQNEFMRLFIREQFKNDLELMRLITSGIWRTILADRSGKGLPGGAECRERNTDRLHDEALPSIQRPERSAPAPHRVIHPTNGRIAKPKPTRLPLSNPAALDKYVNEERKKAAQLRRNWDDELWELVDINVGNVHLSKMSKLEARKGLSEVNMQIHAGGNDIARLVHDKTIFERVLSEPAANEAQVVPDFMSKSQIREMREAANAARLNAYKSVVALAEGDGCS